MITRAKRWYKHLWLNRVFSGIELYRDRERAIAEAAFDEVWFSRWYPAYLVCILTVGYVSGLQLVMATAFVASRSVVLALGMLVLGALAGTALVVGIDLLAMFLMRPFLQRSVRRALRRQGIDVCMECGYPLIRTETSRCTECGALRPVRPPGPPP